MQTAMKIRFLDTCACMVTKYNKRCEAWKKKKTDLIEGPIFQALLVFCDTAADRKSVSAALQYGGFLCGGKLVDTNALAAVGASGSVIQMLVGFFMGLSVGAGVVIAQYFGAGRKEEMSQAIHSALALTVY